MARSWDGSKAGSCADVSTSPNLLRAGQKNALAVRMEKNATPGSVKEKTFDNPGQERRRAGRRQSRPIMLPSAGTGFPPFAGAIPASGTMSILTATGPVTIEDPFVSSTCRCPTRRADVTIEATLHNHEPQPVTGTLRGRFGDMAFERAGDAGAHRTAKTVKHAPAPAESQAVVAGRLWRSESLPR